MHVAGKIFLGLGAVLLVIGLVMSGSGIGSVRDAGDSLEDLGDFAIENTNSGTVNVTDEDGKGDLGFTMRMRMVNGTIARLLTSPYYHILKSVMRSSLGRMPES